MLKFSDISKIFEELELKLIASLKRNLNLHREQEKQEGFNWTAWQAEKLRNMDKFRRENISILNDYSPIIEAKTEELMREQFKEGEDLVTSQLEELKLIVPESTADDLVTTDNFFGINENKMNALVSDITQLEKNVSSAALRMTDDVYRQTLNRVQLAMGTGSMSLQNAIDDATKDFLNKGINCIEYKNGRRINIADYVRMALRTASARASLQGQAKQFAELGYDTVLISQYDACSETCLPWQGRVYIDDVFTVWNGETYGDKGKSNYCGKWFTLLSVAITEGLFHPNCRHSMSIYIDGITSVPKPLNAETVKKNAGLEAQQRRLENKVRKAKRFVNGCTDTDNIKNAKADLRAAQKELREFVNEHSDVLKRDYGREKVYSNETTVKSVDNQSKSGIIKTKRDSMGVSIEIDKFTPCLVEKSTGKIVNTSYSIASQSELKELKKQGWKFDWLDDDLDKADVYKLTLENDKTIQGLIAVTDFPRDRALYINLAESAPHNFGKNKKYEGVGGHLFAMAAKESLDRGYGGFLFLDAKNEELVEYYHDKFGAVLLGMPHQYRMFIDERKSQELLKIYTLKGE